MNNPSNIDNIDIITHSSTTTSLSSPSLSYTSHDPNLWSYNTDLSDTSIYTPQPYTNNNNSILYETSDSAKHNTTTLLFKQQQQEQQQSQPYNPINNTLFPTTDDTYQQQTIMQQQQHEQYQGCKPLYIYTPNPNPIPHPLSPSSHHPTDTDHTDHLPITTTQRRLLLGGACNQCHISKVKCSGDRPCIRCVQSNKTCTDRVCKRKKTSTSQQYDQNIDQQYTHIHQNNNKNNSHNHKHTNNHTISNNVSQPYSDSSCIDIDIDIHTDTNNNKHSNTTLPTNSRSSYILDNMGLPILLLLLLLLGSHIINPPLLYL